MQAEKIKDLKFIYIGMGFAGGQAGVTAALYRNPDDPKGRRRVGFAFCSPKESEFDPEQGQIYAVDRIKKGQTFQGPRRLKFAGSTLVWTIGYSCYRLGQVPLWLRDGVARACVREMGSSPENRAVRPDIASRIGRAWLADRGAKFDAKDFARALAALVARADAVRQEQASKVAGIVEQMRTGNWPMAEGAIG